MGSHISSAIARIQELQARLSRLNPTTNDERPATNVQNLNTRIPEQLNTQPASLFNVALAQANGNVSLHPMINGAGLFAPEIETLIAKYAAPNNLQPDLVRAVIQKESSGNPRLISVAGARGLMQLMPETAAMYGVTDSFDPEQNIAAGTRHLAGLLKEFNDNLSLALAAYNAGSGAVRKYGGIPPYAETQQYVQRILAMLGKTN